MKRKDYENFRISLDLNIEVDSSLRRITEKIKIIAQQRDSQLMRYVVDYLRATDEDLDILIGNDICEGDLEETTK